MKVPTSVPSVPERSSGQRTFKDTCEIIPEKNLTSVRNAHVHLHAPRTLNGICARIRVRNLTSVGSALRRFPSQVVYKPIYTPITRSHFRSKEFYPNQVKRTKHRVWKTTACEKICWSSQPMCGWLLHTYGYLHHRLLAHDVIGSSW